MKRCSALAAERGRQVHRPVHRRRMSRRAYLIPKRRSRPAAQYAAAGGASAAAPRKYRHFPFGTIVAVVVLAAAVWLLFAGGREDPVSDLKGITFDAYDTTCTLGEAVAKNTSHAGWQSAKETDGSYLVTLDCVEKMYGMSLKVTFSVTYTDDWVYGPANQLCIFPVTAIRTAPA